MKNRKEKKGQFECTSPCRNCPYRKDAPRQLWHVEEFENLREKEGGPLGTVFGCHKNNGSVCVGFLMDQEKRNFPSIALRMALIVEDVDREYLDQLSCESALFESIEEMCHANYPNTFDPPDQ